MTARRPLSLMLAALVLACAAPRIARAASPGPPAWWDKAWKFRKSVRVTLPRHGNDIPVTFFEASSLLGERSLTGKAVISVESGTGRLSSEIVVTDAAGNVIPSRSFSRGWEQQATILFKAMPISATYYIYYGNKGAKRKRMEWQRSAFPIVVVSVRASGPADIETPAGAAKALLAAKNVLGKTETYSIQYSRNPFGMSLWWTISLNCRIRASSDHPIAIMGQPQVQSSPPTISWISSQLFNTSSMVTPSSTTGNTGLPGDHSSRLSGCLS